jgi:hypothetical protein
MKARYPFIALVLLLELVLVVGVVWTVGSVGAAAIAEPAVESVGSDQATLASELHVCPTLIIHPSCQYTSIQAAVDAANTNDTIKVAAGIYTDIHYRDAMAQVVYITETINLLGGYVPGFWDTPIPAVNVTVVDAQDQGRGIVISGSIGVVLQGFSVTGGDATGLGGGPPWGYDAVGGGIYVVTATVSLDLCTIYDNVASTVGWGGGGGAYLYNSPSTLMFNLFYSNTASSGTHAGIAGEGGGLAMSGSEANLYGNVFQGNTASAADDGIGGGLYIEGGTPTLANTFVQDNEASATARGDGGGIYVFASDAEFINTVIEGNVSGAAATSEGAGLAAEWASPRFKHTTIHHNTGGDGSGLTVPQFSDSAVTMTNTILVDQSVGISIAQSSSALINGVLWFANGANTGGSGSITVTNDITGAPDLAFDGYHLQFQSAAIDAGVDAEVTYDMDGQTRPYGLPDLGADEFLAVSETIDPVTGGTLIFTDTQGLTTTVEAVAGAVSDSIVLTLLPLFTPTHSLPPGDCFAGHAFFLDGYCPLAARIYLPLLSRGYSSSARMSRSSGLALQAPRSALAQTSEWVPCGVSFLEAVTISISYSEDDLDCVTDEGSLLLYYWGGSQWLDAATTCTPTSTYFTDTLGNLLSVPICHLTEFAIRGD